MIRNITFETFLADKHGEQYIGIKDRMVDDFENWLLDLEIDDWIKLGEQFKVYLKSALLSALPEKLDEYTDDYTKTNGIYSHTENRKRYYNIEENQGFNSAITQCKERIEEVFK